MKSIYRLNIVNIKNVEIKKGKSADIQDEKLFRRNLKLRNNLFIGQFIQNIDSSFKICCSLPYKGSSQCHAILTKN